MDIQKVEEFMRDYFRDRTEVYKRELEIIAPVREKYFNRDCNYDSRKGSVARSESEVILKTQQLETGWNVVTQATWGEEIGAKKKLYKIRQSESVLLICDVTMECNSCKGEAGKADCFACGGSGWLDIAGMRKWAELKPKPPSEPEPILNKLFSRLRKHS